MTSEKKIPQAQLEAQLTYWKSGADADLETAKDILENTLRYGAALFFLHLSLEKLLKTLFVKKKSSFAPLTHNLLSLAERCDLNLSTEHTGWLAEINEFNMITRYPSAKNDFYSQATKEFASLHFEHGKTLYQWILDHLKK